jgi:hypothetical protein
MKALKLLTLNDNNISVRLLASLPPELDYFLLASVLASSFGQATKLEKT